MRAAGRKARCGWLPLRRNISSSASGRAPFAQAMLAGYYYKPSGARGAEKSAVFCHAAVYPRGQCPTASARSHMAARCPVAWCLSYGS